MTQDSTDHDPCTDETGETRELENHPRVEISTTMRSGKNCSLKSSIRGDKWDHQDLRVGTTSRTERIADDKTGDDKTGLDTPTPSLRLERDWGGWPRSGKPLTRLELEQYTPEQI